MSDDIVTDVVRELLAGAEDDFVGLWEVPTDLRLRSPGAVEDEIRLLAEPVIRALVDAGLRVGELVSGRGFVAWDVRDHVAAALTFWDRLGREPNLGDDIWLARPTP